jgi:hypothetical protein
MPDQVPTSEAKSNAFIINTPFVIQPTYTLSLRARGRTDQQPHPYHHLEQTQAIQVVTCDLRSFVSL